MRNLRVLPIVAAAVTLAPLFTGCGAPASRDLAAVRLTRLVRALDAKPEPRFTLKLDYYPGKVKPLLYSMMLTATASPVPPGLQGLQERDMMLLAQISKAQAARIIEHLRTEGFLARAKDVSKQKPKRPTERCYVLNVHGGRHLREVLGWNLAMLRRLKGLRRVLDGPAAAAMDKVLAPLERQRWE